MDKAAIKRFATTARSMLMERVAQKAAQFGITPTAAEPAEALSINGKLLSAAEQQQKDVHEIAERLRGTIDEHLQEIEKQQTHAAKKASIQAMRQSIKEGDVLGAFGGSQEWADKYNAVAGTYDPMKTNGVIDEYLTATGVTIPAEVEWTNNEATFNDVVIGVEAVLDQYSANEVAAALEYLTDEEREAVQTAIEKTESKVDGRDRMKVINFMYFQKGTKPDRRDLEYAALKVPCQYETAKRWHREFVNEVGRNFRCNGLPKH